MARVLRNLLFAIFSLLVCADVIVSRRSDVLANSGVAPATIQDWWFLDGPRFLQNYTNSFSDSKIYQQRGLTGSLISCLVHEWLLIDADARDALVSNECSNILKQFPGEVGKQQAKMTLAGITNYVGLMKLVKDNLDAAMLSAGGRLKSSETVQKWWTNLLDSEKYTHAQNLLRHALTSVFTTAMPWKDAGDWVSEAGHIAWVDWRNKAPVPMGPGYTNSPNRWDTLFGTIVDEDIDELRATPEFDPRPVEEKNWEYPALKVSQHEFRSAGESAWVAAMRLVDYVVDRALPANKDIINKRLSLQDYYFEVAKRASEPIKDAINGVVNGNLRVAGVDGSVAQKLFVYGNILNINQANFAEKDASFEPALSQRLTHFGLNAALVGSKLYWISCTNEFRYEKAPIGDRIRPAACARDNHGYWFLKACLTEPDEACYIWGFHKQGIHGKQVSPPDSNQWVRTLGVSAPALITANVRAYDNNLIDYRLSTSFLPAHNATSGTPLTELANPESGSYQLPVCFSRYNLGRPTQSEKRTFPCHCGAWGRDTPSLWAQTSLANPKNNMYMRDNCVYVVRKYILDPLEQYVAQCRLGFRTPALVNGGKHRHSTKSTPKSGKDRYCDIVIHLVETRGIEGSEELNPEERFALGCKLLGVGGKDRCRKMDSVWKKWEENFKTGRGGRAYEAVGDAPAPGAIRGPGGEWRSEWGKEKNEGARRKGVYKGI